jgi:hypothetical protein
MKKRKKNVCMFATRYMKHTEVIKRKDIINNVIVTYVSHFTILFLSIIQVTYDAKAIAKIFLWNSHIWRRKIVSVSFKSNFPAPLPQIITMATSVRIFHSKLLALSPLPITDLSNRGQRSSGTNASLAIAGGILQINGHVSFRNQGVEELLDTFSLVTGRLSEVNWCVASNKRLH